MTPAALGRSSRRLARAGVFVYGACRHVDARLRPLADVPATSLRRRDYLAHVAATMCSLHGVRISVAGELPRVGPAIMVANHVSYLDPLLVMSVVPTLAIAKHEVGAWPILGEFARGLDLLLVDRARAHSGARVLLRAKTLLERGVSILVFPEGTTTCGEQVLPFKRGMFGLAARLGLPVVPIALRYADTRMAWVGDASFLPHYLATTTRERLEAQLEFGAPMHAHRGEAAEQFAARVREAMCRRLCPRTPRDRDHHVHVHHPT